MSASPAKRYLGDAVYADFDGHGIVLTTEDGIRATNTIVLDSEVYLALTHYVRDIMAVVRKVQAKHGKSSGE